MKPHYLQISRNPCNGWDTAFITSRVSNLYELLDWTYMYAFRGLIWTNTVQLNL
ncbi:hypothetical protein PL9214670055 [Planktothrix tepida PCC 9214]|uniref:Uncharacterized protein n=1 Tax=Planktothrix tepida PCC 9214 TaxID=671072 RepID=A0A1J1LS64_9CYAN|nr:hypothetical protein PL9214670055 [Planktothrix tepida PCC 9214]